MTADDSDQIITKIINIESNLKTGVLNYVAMANSKEKQRCMISIFSQYSTTFLPT